MSGNGGPLPRAHLDEEGLRETFLAALPPEVRDQLREIVRGLHGLVAGHGLLFTGSEMEPEDALLVGLWKELGHLRRLTGALERGARGSRRFTFRKIRVLLEDAEGTVALAVPEELR